MYLGAVWLLVHVPTAQSLGRCLLFLSFFSSVAVTQRTTNLVASKNTHLLVQGSAGQSSRGSAGPSAQGLVKMLA